MEKRKINIQVEVNAPVEKVWEFWTSPSHVVKWNSASDDWHTTKSENDLRVGGKFFSRMEAKDGSNGFDFTGVYDKVENNKLIEYTMSDGRKVIVEFTQTQSGVNVSETFEMESENSEELQRSGWQSILNNFKKYVEQ